MAIYHASIRPPVTRSTGRSATAASAYRAGCIVVDTRTGEIHDYTRKRGVMHADILLPGGGHAPNRAEFWNRVEAHHKRGDAVVARELVAAIPDELPPHAQIQLARAMGLTLSNEYGIAVDVCVHEPSRSGDDRNTHVHFLMTACHVSDDGNLGRKCEPLDPIHCARRKIPNAAEWIRPVWQQLANQALADAGSDARIDHRSHAARGLTEVPGSHHGPAVTEILRSGRDSDVADRIAAEAAAIIGRQVLDAQAAAVLLDAQAAQAAADLAIELEIERVQEAAEAAQRAQDLAEQAQAAQEAQEAAQRAQAIDALRIEYSALAEQKKRAEAEHRRLCKVLESAAPAAQLAEREQSEAGQSLLKTALAVPKISGWKRALEAYELAAARVEKVEKLIDLLASKMAKCWQKLIAIEPQFEKDRQAMLAKAFEKLGIKSASELPRFGQVKPQQRPELRPVQHDAPEAADVPDVPRG